MRRPRPPRLICPPLRPADRASSDVHSCAVPFWCAARPPLLAISRCFSGVMDANPRRSFRSPVVRPGAKSIMVRLSVWPSRRTHDIWSSVGLCGRILDGRGFGFVRGGNGCLVGIIRRTRAFVFVLHCHAVSHVLLTVLPPRIYQSLCQRRSVVDGRAGLQTIEV